MDRSLDEIVAESQQRKRGSRPRRGGRTPREREPYPRDGVRKSTRDDSRNLDSEWVHDRFDDSNSRDRPRQVRRRPSPERAQDVRGTKIKVENLHYELTEDDLDGLFNKIGPVTKLELLYDRAGRSEGVAFVTYGVREDALEAVKQYDGANAKGQPIRMTIVASAPRRNPFDTAHMPSRPLAERITRPRSLSPRRRPDNDRGIDRYVPGIRSRSRSPRRRGGRRPGIRREGDAPNGREKVSRDGRPKKTQEELDAEMADYFNPGGPNDPVPGPVAAAAGNADAPVGGDVDMIE
ncbi:RNA-binding domain-containing protein [Durotheca rogersii]|uniref:RNA-binding domain-containing protein n=1 Tax=Durotheca rogersii TaxID=419775 RepID=UPI0022210860|nr:RNA-binding domain-containing protein [Durotheca rogersii]KAI5868309.1 RNA-binding domain-containing protein [Durotheca rogersii]